MTVTPSPNAQSIAVVWGPRTQPAPAIVAPFRLVPGSTDLLEGIAQPAAADLLGIPYASTAVVLLVYHEGTQPSLPDGTGFVVPRGRAPMTACTWLSSKWPREDYGTRAVVRAGRLGRRRRRRRRTGRGPCGRVRAAPGRPGAAARGWLPRVIRTARGRRRTGRRIQGVSHERLVLTPSQHAAEDERQDKRNGHHAANTRPVQNTVDIAELRPATAATVNVVATPMLTVPFMPAPLAGSLATLCPPRPVRRAMGPWH